MPCRATLWLDGRKNYCPLGLRKCIQNQTLKWIWSSLSRWYSLPNSIKIKRLYHLRKTQIDIIRYRKHQNLRKSILFTSKIWVSNRLIYKRTRFNLEKKGWFGEKCIFIGRSQWINHKIQDKYFSMLLKNRKVWRIHKSL
jgi:hypothetical protein